jgi:hypothetical protein
MLNTKDQESYCKYILESPNISNKIVVLCEGTRPKIDRTQSPQSFRQKDNSPDADFYRACIPANLQRRYMPEFLNCGSRGEVLDTYYRLIQLHKELSPSGSYLSPDKLFALVDADLSNTKIDNYHLSSTEEIFHELYEELQLRVDRLHIHRIWVTGFKHKEAYFLNPALQGFLHEYEHDIHYKGNKLHLDTIYQDMAKDICTDTDLAINFATAVQRIAHHSDIDTSTPESLQQSWTEHWSENTKSRDDLAHILLAISKSKDYWNQVRKATPTNYTQFRSTLGLQIATKFYAQLQGEEIDRHHLSGLFGYLQKFAKS